MELFTFIVVVGMFAVIGIVLYNKKVEGAWSNAATKLRLDFSDGVGGRVVKGRHGQIRLEVRTEVIGKSTWTLFRAEFPRSLPFSIRLRPQTFLSNLGNAVRNRIDLETGDTYFDSKVIVESRTPEKARDFLDKENRSTVLKLIARFDDFDMNEDRVVVRRRKLISSTSDLVENVQNLENSVRDLLNSAVPRENKKPIPPPLPARENRTEQGVRITAGALEKAEEEAEISIVALPVAGAIEQAVETRDSTAPHGIAAPRETALVETAEPVSVEYDPLFAHHCRKILSDCHGRYAMKKQFETELLGIEVDDQFILKSEEPYSMHKVFGRGPGKLRTFSLGDLPDGNELFLVADTDTGASRFLKRSFQQQLESVEGQLVSFDPFSYTLFLQTRQNEPEDPVSQNSFKQTG